MSLRTLKNNIIQFFGDPKIHFSSIAWRIPARGLPLTLYAGGNVDAKLEQETCSFF
jgi:hypothetical protein